MLPLLGHWQAQRDYALLTLASALTHNPPSCHHEDNKSKASTFADVPGECSQTSGPPVTAPPCSPKSNRSLNFHTADNWRGRGSKRANYAFSNFISPNLLVACCVKLLHTAQTRSPARSPSGRMPLPCGILSKLYITGIIQRCPHADVCMF